MAPIRRPYEFIADQRRAAEQLRVAEYENAVRQFVRVGELEAGSVTAGIIAANAVGANEIQVDAVGGSELADGAVGNTKIVGGAITADKLAVRTITTDRIGIGQVGSGEIADGTLTGVEIADGTITANKMNVGSLSAISANLGTVTAGVVTGATVQSGASGIRAVLDAGGLKLVNDVPGGSSGWSNITWRTNDDQVSTGAIRGQTPLISPGNEQANRMEMTSFTTIASNQLTTSAITTRNSNGSLLGRVQVDGDGDVIVSNTPVVGSDRALKEDIADLGESLPKVRKLKPRRYKRKVSGNREIGLVAQEVAEVFPDVVREIPPTPEAPEVILGVQYEALIPAAIAAVQELADAHDSLEKRVKDLEPKGQTKKP